jgi:hypothetical protein
METQTNRPFLGGDLGRESDPMASPDAPAVSTGAILCPSPARESVDCAPAPYFYGKGWTVEQERASRLARIFTAIDKARSKGRRTMHKLLRRAAWTWRGRFYACDPSQPIRFAEPTLRNLYYRRWIGGGRKAEALLRDYWRRPASKVSRGQTIELAELCLAGKADSFSEAYRRLESPSATESAHRRAVPPRFRSALAALLANRRHGRVLEKAARQALDANK